jgi:hypothetical protein
MKATNTANPTPAALADLRALFDDRPALWKAIGDLTKRTRDQLITETFTDALGRESVARFIADYQAQLGYADAPLIERLIIDQIVNDYLRLFSIGTLYGHKMKDGTTAVEANYYDRAWARAERRYLGALETLARVRRLTRPRAVQINIGAQQVNIAQLRPD